MALRCIGGLRPIAAGEGDPRHDGFSSSPNVPTRSHVAVRARQWWRCAGRSNGKTGCWFPTDDDRREAWLRSAADGIGGPGVVDRRSFRVMRRHGLTEAFTNDRHCRSAGFELF